MKIIYVAGAYRNEDANGVWDNIIHARRVARQLWKMGLVAICPHMNTAFMDGYDILPKTFLEGDLELLRRCDGILMLSNWKQSEGAIREWEVAKELEIPVIYEADGLLEFIMRVSRIKYTVD